MGKISKVYLDYYSEDIVESTEEIQEAKKISIDTIKDQIREFGYKIKLVIPTKFGIQLDLFSNIGEDIEDFLSTSSVQYKINKNSLFIEL